MNEKDLVATDILGRTVTATFTKSASGYIINLPEASNGMYLLRNEKTGEVVRFVKE